MNGEQVKPAYERSEVGVIPRDWKAARIGELSDRVTVGFVGSMSHLFEKDGIPLLRGQNILPNSLDLTDTKFISTYTHSLWKKSALSPGDVVVVRVGYPGTSCVIPPDLREANAASLVVITPRKKILDSHYLAYVLNSEFGKKQIVSNLVGGAQQVINTKAAADFSLPIPSFEEQQAIAEIFSDTDDLLAKINQLIAKKRDIKQAAMQQLLTGKTRLPGFFGQWEVKRLGDVGDCLRGVTYKGDVDLSAHDTAYTKRLLRSNNVQDSTVIINDLQFVNAGRVSEHQLLRKRDILICMANGSKALVGKAGFFDIEDSHEYTFGAFMGCFRTKIEESNPAFVFYLFQTSRYKDYINNLLAGSSINNLNPGSIESLEFKIPKMEEQTAIASVLLDIDSELQCLEARCEKIRALKKGMMHELLTGRVRLI